VRCSLPLTNRVTEYVLRLCTLNYVFPHSSVTLMKFNCISLNKRFSCFILNSVIIAYYWEKGFILYKRTHTHIHTHTHTHTHHQLCNVYQLVFNLYLLLLPLNYNNGNYMIFTVFFVLIFRNENVQVHVACLSVFI
jgi:hypothetical protein